MICPGARPARGEFALVDFAALQAKTKTPGFGFSNDDAEKRALACLGLEWRPGVRPRHRDRRPVLRGANPAEIPVRQPSDWLLGINLKAARELGIEVPAAVAVRADYVVR